MQILRTKAEVRQTIKLARREGKTVGFVPTMGYLHNGHLSLMAVAKKENDLVVTSVFVNPTQFGPAEDFSKYPRDLERDIRLMETVGVDIVFAPEVEEMYGAQGALTFVDISQLSDHLCGAKRPGHFRGVCTVVTKLFNIVQPDCAYFGQKDAQQALIIKRMVHDLDIPVEVKALPTVREADNLAMSSRNIYLNPEERQAALILSRSLALAQQMIKDGERDAAIIIAAMRELIAKEPLARIDYISLVSQETVQPTEKIDGPILLALAVFVGKTRLIDNIMLEEV